MITKDDILFEVETPIGFKVRVTKDYWHTITTQKHPVMAGQDEFVRVTIQDPDEIRRSRSEPTVYLFYRTQRSKRWVCAVTKEIAGNQGFLITAYITDAIKEGERIWTR
ncbi:MAG: DUF4258 domain-containing protein [Bacteroidota bacterium]|nr:DUF4258 domain-containing protein [Bacteroidota bacterium]MDP4232293.1 DUF4258 domain-containing protein [Bacteroidota bacterium]MDP4241432.1 DUF4258 domain-containing protein [Bacteroidota bacterium]MDP4286744.1 DUF4258 domain-containing protein [Bacteroidota bacterium]